MSYDLWMEDPETGEEMALDHTERGGTYAVGGSSTVEFNITYNYAPHFGRVLGSRGIRTIYGLTGAEAVPVLTEAASQLGDDVDPDYWKSTEGNAKAALHSLIRLSKSCPTGIWNGD